MEDPVETNGKFEKLFSQYIDTYCEDMEIQEPANDTQLLDEVLVTLQDILKEEIDKDSRLFNAIEVVLKRAIKLRGMPACEASSPIGNSGSSVDAAGGFSNRPEVEGCGCGSKVKPKKVVIVKTKRQRKKRKR